MLFFFLVQQVKFGILFESFSECTCLKLFARKMFVFEALSL